MSCGTNRLLRVSVGRLHAQCLRDESSLGRDDDRPPRSSRSRARAGGEVVSTGTGETRRRGANWARIRSLTVVWMLVGGGAA